MNVNTVTLKADIVEQINDLVKYSDSQVNPDEIVDQALRHYLRELRRQKLRREQQAFEQQKNELLAEYFGEYVAIHEGQVIDHDRDLRTLNSRVFKKLGRTTVLHKKVTDEPEQDIMLRSPRLEQG